ncbi:MAG: 23S rRNA (pseudouridine(1915)-N(3))-methyltransferase RlmH [Alphaproteobacteria bacterium]|nr:MAG: 23S rRNA (pseudouridine(1915)-N(3))-methyltransferase RlmH [Alphaproteobacteria bacterium]
MIKLISTGKKSCPDFNAYTKRINQWKLQILTYNKAPRYLELIEPKKEKIVLLDERGKHMTSVQFSEFLEPNENLCFIVGAATGFPKELFSVPHQKISLSSMTFPHELARILLIEQIYRAQQILRNHPYHKD